MVTRPPTNRPWSAPERTTLAAIADTFVPVIDAGDAERRTDLVTAAIDRLDPDDASKLRLVLRVLDSPSANLLLVGRRAPFARLNRPSRERALLGWATSVVPARRTAFQALKKLSCFVAYADPGGPTGGRNPRWAAIGYEPPVEPVTATPTPIQPLDPGATRDLEADVVVVGSGAGGGVMAAELAAAGRDVIVLEAGPFVAEPDMPTDELTAFDRLYLDHGLTSTDDGAISILAGSSVGGGTTINWLTSIPIQPTIRRAWAVDHGLDGLDGAEFDADVAAVEAELSVQGPPTVPAKDATLLRGAAGLGWDGAETRRNGVDCGNCGGCSFGCRRGAKQGGLRVHLADAWRRGARIVPDASVERIVIDASRARRVEAVLVGGRRLMVHADQVVIAAGALRTPGILARSGCDHPAIGRFLRLHPVAVVGAMLDEPIEMWSGTTQAARSLEFLESRTPDGSGFTIESAPGHPGLIALAFPWASGAEFERLMIRARSIAPLIAICRDLGGGRIDVTRSGRTRIVYRVGPTEVETLRRGLIAMARLARAAGAREIVALGTPAASFSGGPERAFAAFVDRLARFDFSPNRGLVFSAHQMGTARMGTNPADHPCDERGRVRVDRAGRFVRGLYVADASLFPTAIGVNPMITTMALAKRVARTVCDELPVR